VPRPRASKPTTDLNAKETLVSKIKLALASTALLATAGLTGPALAAAPTAKLAEAPTAWMAPSIGKHTVGVTVHTDRALKRRASGGVIGGVRLHGHVGSLSRLGAVSAHCYVAYVKDAQARPGQRAVAQVFVTQGDSPRYDRKVTIRQAAMEPAGC
jgi:hypothetical protein